MFILGLLALINLTAQIEPLRLTAFDNNDLGWQVVNDTVMGGRSSSRYLIRDGELRFNGILNTNGGGFTSLRTERREFDLGAFDLVRLKVLGDGRSYRFRAYVEGDRASYQHDFATTEGEWRIVELPVADFYASWRGRRLSRPPLQSADITSLGIILADGRDGEFTLVVDWIEFDRAADPSLVQAN